MDYILGAFFLCTREGAYLGGEIPLQPDQGTAGCVHAQWNLKEAGQARRCADEYDAHEADTLAKMAKIVKAETDPENVDLDGTVICRAMERMLGCTILKEGLGVSRRLMLA